MFSDLTKVTKWWSWDLDPGLQLHRAHNHSVCGVTKMEVQDEKRPYYRWYLPLHRISKPSLIDVGSLLCLPRWSVWLMTVLGQTLDVGRCGGSMVFSKENIEFLLNKGGRRYFKCGISMEQVWMWTLQWKDEASPWVEEHRGTKEEHEFGTS